MNVGLALEKDELASNEQEANGTKKRRRKRRKKGRKKEKLRSPRVLGG
jgi:hypothetical protein